MMRTLWLYLALMHQLVAPMPPTGCDPPSCPGDFNCDGLYGTDDILYLISAWGIDDSADITGNGVTDVGDLMYVLFNYGLYCDGTSVHNF